MEILAAALNLLTLPPQEVRVIGELNKCFEFDNNLFLLDSSADISRVVGNGIEPKSLFIFESANGSVTGLESLRKIRSKNALVIVVPGCSTLDMNLNLVKLIKKIKRFAPNVKIGIFFRDATSMDDLRSHFLCFRDQFFVNVFAAVYPSGSRLLNIFTFHSFGNFEVINVTSRNACEEFFPSLDSNYHQYNFRIAPFTNIALGQFWLTALELMNGTFTIENVRYETFAEYLRSGIEIVPTLGTYSPKSSRFHIYPVLMTNLNLVVPEAEPYSGFYAYLRIMTSNEFFGYSAGAMVAVALTLSATRYIKEKKILLSQSLMDVLNLLMNDNSFINYQRLSRAEAFLIVPLTFVGFIVVNGYLSNLQSYLTKPALQPQLKTVEDIYNSPLTIAVQQEIADAFLEWVTYRSTHKDWSKKISAIETKYYRHQLHKFNTSTAYLLIDLDMDTYSRAQRRLNMRGLYDTGVTVMRSLSMFLVSDKVLFFDKLNEIIHRTHSSGLLKQWLKESEADMDEMILHVYRKILSNQQATANEFEFPMFIVYGWIASTIVLIIEIMWSKAKAKFE